MNSNKTGPKTIDEYIAAFPPQVQEILQQVRATVAAAAPGAQEKISYQMPAFTMNGKILVYFAAHKSHIGLYPAPRAIEEFKEELAGYEGAKGTARFPFDYPLPLDLITRIVVFRVKELSAGAGARARKKE